MKTAYELAMERLAQKAPSLKLSDEQKKALAELDSACKAKIAEREIASQGVLQEAEAKGDFEAAEKARAQLTADRQKLLAELEEKKQRIRQSQA